MQLRGVWRGLGELAEFLRESARAMIDVAIGRWPQPFGEMRRKRTAMSPVQDLIKKITPYPVDD